MLCNDSANTAVLMLVLFDGCTAVDAAHILLQRIMRCVQCDACALLCM